MSDNLIYVMEEVTVNDGLSRYCTHELTRFRMRLVHLSGHVYSEQDFAEHALAFAGDGRSLMVTPTILGRAKILRAYVDVIRGNVKILWDEPPGPHHFVLSYSYFYYRDGRESLEWLKNGF